jgi:hypothetical protein
MDLASHSASSQRLWLLCTMYDHADNLIVGYASVWPFRSQEHSGWQAHPDHRILYTWYPSTHYLS